MDWFMKADDDTYVVVENLRYFLYVYTPDMPIYFGHDFKHQFKHYMSGAAGYVREALHRFINVAMPDSGLCPPEAEQIAEDRVIGKCLRSVRVLAGDSRDVHNELRFIPYAPHILLTDGYLCEENWYFAHRVYHTHVCQNCLPKQAVSFHYMTSKFQLFTTKNESEVLSKKLGWDEVKIPAKFNAWDITEN